MSKANYIFIHVPFNEYVNITNLDSTLKSYKLNSEIAKKYERMEMNYYTCL